ncbi:hypothetical protein ABZX40_18060 [Streptomyces sp. NPDC004610]|uniref:hypothetical protein n=1 Tax=unclassified Streptomyces TaxID=2593676 RepID=UPI0033B49282
MTSPLSPPDPLPHCIQCWDWASARRRALAAGNLARVIDLNILLRTHHTWDPVRAYLGGQIGHIPRQPGTP